MRHNFRLSLKQWAVLSTAVVAIPLLIAQYVLNYSYFIEVQSVHMEQRISDIVERTEALLLFPVATSDNEGIEKVVEELMKDETIYAVHIKNDEGDTIIHKESDMFQTKDGSEKILRKVGHFQDKRPLSGDSLFTLDSANERTYGSFILYLSTARSENAIIRELNKRSLIFISMVLISALLMYLIMKESHKHALRITKHIKTILLGKYSNETEFGALQEFKEISLGLNDLGTQLQEKITDLEKSKKEAIEAKDKSEKANYFKDEFIHIISHELRGPVNTITNLIDQFELHISSSNISELGKSHYSVCKLAADDLRNVVNQLVNFDNLESNSIQLELAVTSLTHLFNSIYQFNVRKFKEKGIVFNVMEKNMMPKGERIYVTDQVKLKQIVNNLLENAFKFTIEGSVNIDWGVSENVLYIECRDSGIGIPESSKSDIFVPFYQVEKKRIHSNIGHGLGLAIVKSLVNAFNGSITVQSTLNVGTVFSVEIPLHSHVKSREDNDTNPTEASKKYTVSVAVIDDEVKNGYTIEAMLKSLGVKVFRYDDPCDAVEAIKDNPVDLVFVDLHMPKLDGFAVARELKSVTKGHYLSVVCVTADTHRSTSEAIRESSLDGLIFKPIELSQLVKYLNSAEQAVGVKNLDFKH